MLPQTIRPVPRSHLRHWSVFLNGAPVAEVVSVILHSESFGTLEYGLRPSVDEDDWIFRESGGGGAVTLPYSRAAGRIVVGLVEEARDNLGGRYLCALGGFVDPGETHRQAAAREANEEGGVVGRPLPLSGLAACSNRRFFACRPDLGEGVHAFAVEVPAGDLESQAVGLWQHKHWRHRGSPVQFMPWQDAVRRTPDALARAAIAQLLADLSVQGIVLA